MPKAEYDKFWLNVQCTVDKDVVRTDRSHPYFAGNDNPNVEIMRYNACPLFQGGSPQYFRHISNINFSLMQTLL